MLDPKYLRGDIQQTAEKLKRRGFELDVNSFIELEEKRKSLQIKTQELQKINLWDPIWKEPRHPVRIESRLPQVQPRPEAGADPFTAGHDSRGGSWKGPCIAVRRP